jgi:hypothetical protein
VRKKAALSRRKVRLVTFLKQRVIKLMAMVKAPAKKRKAASLTRVLMGKAYEGI